MSIFLQDVSVADNTPASMSPGESVDVELIITKNEVSGFAKLQLEVPEGLSISPLETQGASFTFSQQKAKFIWMQLPEIDEIKIRYTLISKADCRGSKTISGTFSYIDDNDRIDYKITPRTVEVGDVDLIASTDDTSIISPESPDEAPIASLTQTDSPVYREITQLGDKEYQVKVIVKDMDVEGYAKIQENLPPTYSITNKNSGGSVVTIDGTTIKYVWFQKPQTEELSVIYIASTTGNLPLNVDGSFSYVEDNAPTSMKISTVGSLPSEAIAANNEGSINDEEPSLSEEAQSAMEEAEEEVEETLAEIEQESEASLEDINQNIQGSIEPIAENQIDEVEEAEPLAETTVETVEVAEAEPEPVDEEVMVNIEEEPEEMSTSTSIPEPETGVSYRVQIAAGPNTVGKSYFRNRHRFTEKFNIENHEGWVKYTTGSHSAYREARDERERITASYNFDGPFVTAYNQGLRITVQEALMITNQDWIQ